MEQFKALEYFQDIKNRLKLLEGFEFCRISSKETMEELLDNARSKEAFFCIDDTEDGQTLPSAGGYVERRVYVVWILKKYRSRGTQAMQDLHGTMELCREIYRDILSKIISDKGTGSAGLTYVSDRFPFYEVPLMLFPEVAGIYFMLTVDIPICLVMKPESWRNGTI